MAVLELPRSVRYCRQELYNYQHALALWVQGRLKPLSARNRKIITIAGYTVALAVFVTALFLLEGLSPWVTHSYGIVMVILSLTAIMGGMPKEIIANYRNKTAPDTLRSFLSWGFAAYLMRTVYTGSVGDILTAAAAFPGAIGAFILIVQQRIYPTSHVKYYPIRVVPKVRRMEGGQVTVTLEISAGQLAEVQGKTGWAREGEVFFTYECSSDPSAPIGGSAYQIFDP